MTFRGGISAKERDLQRGWYLCIKGSIGRTARVRRQKIVGWKEREKGKENRGRGLKENRKQGSWEKGQIELGRERKLIKLLILVDI